ncbi:TonB family protein [Methyloglobulus morosus KoM1]|uniref:TonB family protein n=1 Tax=Methyloglobulus morosus KoM1 TaxID=1116472 RepID=V5BDS2_9GAMM|nr:energy transducer TonB [Methyloglobulus morosus]ESS71455.1 TonB family protein [Methyloglobulus morosus KoM1]
MENSPTPVPWDFIEGKGNPKVDLTWAVLGLVMFAHLTTFAALHPGQEPLPEASLPQPIMVSLLGEPQVIPQKSEPLPPEQKRQKSVNAKNIAKKLTQQPQKAMPIAHKRPAFKPVVAQEQSSKTESLVTPPKTEASQVSAVTPNAAKTSKPSDETPIYRAPNFNAAYLHNPNPNYPAISRRLGEQGKVLLQVQVTADGTASLVVLHVSSGSERLDQAALEAVKKWRFIPAKRGEQAVSASVIVPVRFSIEG